MLSHTVFSFLQFGLILTASVPLRPFIIASPSQNLTTLSSSRNATNLLGTWPATPFSRHFAYDTDIEIIDRTPSSPSDPHSQSDILGDIRLIGAKVRSEGTRLAMMSAYHRISGAVEFAFEATEQFTFRGSEIAMVVDTIWELTNLYGAARIYGSLVNTGVNVAFFELGLMPVSSA